ncbi:MAG: helix-turn-helix transcriptional regulator [Burkholderiaceae bacterium]|nr:helix-turn-helix transcriptional regulator [Burkholderiaceae bacterium]
MTAYTRFTMSPSDPVISGFYRAASGLEPWQGALDRIVTLTDSWFCQMIGVDKATGRIAFSLQSSEAPIDGVLDYVREYHRLDPHIRSAETSPVGQAYNGSRIVPARHVSANPFYRDFFLPHGARYTVGVKTIDDEHLFSMCAILRKPDQPIYGAAAERTMEALGYHLAQSVQVMRKVSTLATQASIGQLLLDRSDRPSFLVDSTKALRYANRAGLEVLARGGVFAQRGGFLGCVDPVSDALLLDRLMALDLQADPAHEGPKQTRLAFPIRDAGTDKPVPVSLWALRPEGTMGVFGTHSLALMTLAIRQLQASPDPLVLASMFDLTPAESAVALQLCEGKVAKEVARKLRVSEQTIRFHLKGLFRKVGVSSQRELLHQLRIAAELCS